jgi:phage terminase large subunit-like protein
VPVELVHASRGKQTRAEPISAIYEQGRAHHVGSFPALEDEMCLWVPGDASPNRMDAHVWAATRLMLGTGAAAGEVTQVSTSIYKSRRN